MLDAAGRPIGFKEQDGDETFFPTLNSSQDGFLKPDGSAISVGSAATVVSKNTALSGAGSVSSSAYSRTRAAIARVKAGTGHMKIGLVGDSTQMGGYALGFANGKAPNCRAVSHTPFFAAAMNSVAAPAIHSSFIGDSNVVIGCSSTLPLYDPRVTLAAGWASAPTTKCAGGYYLQNSTNTAAVTFLPNEPVDTFDVYYAVNPGLASFTLGRSGDTTSAAISSAGTAGMGKSTFVGALGSSSALYVQRNGTGGTMYLMGVDAYNSTRSAIRCINIGWWGGKVADWALNVQAFDPLPATLALGCDLYVVNSPINEWASATGAATFQAQLDAYVAALLVVGDVLLVTGYPSQNSSFTLAVQKPYIDAIYAVALKYNLAVNDMWQKLGSWEQNNAFGYYADSLHPVSKLYQLTAEANASLILSL